MGAATLAASRGRASDRRPLPGSRRAHRCRRTGPARALLRPGGAARRVPAHLERAASTTPRASSNSTATCSSAAATSRCRSSTTRCSTPSARRTTPGSACALDLGERAIRDALERAGLPAATTSRHLFFVTVTGLATPVDRRAAREPPAGCAATCKRTPIFGLGCVAGAAGIARAADALRGLPGRGRGAALGRALQPDAAARRPLDPEPDRERPLRRRRRGGGARRRAQRPGAGPRVVATRSVVLPGHRARDGLGDRRARASASCSRATCRRWRAASARTSTSSSRSRA